MPISETELFIAGGYSFGELSDAYLVDPRSREAKKVIS